MSAHAELVILRHELAETRRKLDAERVNADNAYIKLAETLRLLEAALPCIYLTSISGNAIPAHVELYEAIRAHLAAYGGSK